jgi:Flp pilus assembly protein TadD
LAADLAAERPAHPGTVSEFDSPSATPLPHPLPPPFDGNPVVLAPQPLEVRAPAVPASVEDDYEPEVPTRRGVMLVGVVLGVVAVVGVVAVLATGSGGGATAKKPEVAKQGSVVAKPATGAPADPSVVKPSAATGETAKAEAAKPEAAKPEGTGGETAKPEAAKPEVAAVEAAKPEPAKPEVAKAEAATAEGAAKGEATKGEGANAAKPEAANGAKVEAAKGDVAQADVADPSSSASALAKPKLDSKAEYHQLLEEGRTLYRHGQARRALVPLEKAVAIKADGDEALVLLANCHLDRGDYERALSVAQLASAANPENADAYLVIGAVQQEKSHNAEARTAYERYLKLAPKGQYAGEIRSILATLH